MKSFIMLAALLLLTACDKAALPEPIVRTVEVKVPVTQYRKPPASLKRTPIKMPVFVSPTDKNATSALTPEGENLFKAYVIDRESRLDVWEKSGF